MQYDLTILSMAKGLASHATTRQTLVSQNIANADTAGYRARDVKPFAAVYDGPGAPNRGAEAPSAPVQTANFMANATRPGHFGFSEQARTMDPTPVYEVFRKGAESPNGNSVSLEDQMVRGARAVADHELAIGVMRKSMDLIRLAIGRR